MAGRQLIPYWNLLGHLPMTTSASSPATTCFSPLSFWPLTKVPILVFRSSIVIFDLLDRLCAWPRLTSATLMVRCLREMVLCDMAS